MRGWMTVVGVVSLVFAAMVLVAVISQNIAESKAYNARFGNYWELADRSSTIAAKSQYIGQFVDALNSSRFEFAEYAAIYYQTPENRFDTNLQAVSTLRDRLNDISKMNDSSFEYQMAIQQITGQEQGEAANLLHVFDQSFAKQSYPLAFNAYAIIALLCVGILALLGFAFIAADGY